MIRPGWLMVGILVAGALPAAASAAGGGNGNGGAGATGAAAPPGGGVQVKSHEHRTERNGMNIVMWEKWPAGPEDQWRKSNKVVLLVHGATWSSRCTFDPAPGYSMMDALAEAGFDVFALDLHGYGKSDKSDKDWTEAAAAAQDIDAAVDYIRALRWVDRVHLFGFQWGAQPTALFAINKSNKVGRVVLFGMRYSLIERKGADPESQYRTNSVATAMLKPDDGDLDPDFVRKRAHVCAAADPQSPNGALRDLAQASPVDPTRLHSGTMLVMGDHDADPDALADRLEFFKALGARHKWFVVLPGLGKYAPIERAHSRLEAAIVSFLNQP